jgi:hypothetical protein
MRAERTDHLLRPLLVLALAILAVLPVPNASQAETQTQHDSLGRVIRKDPCTPTTCAAQGAACGTISDGCGGTLTCPTCPVYYTCQSNKCVADKGTCSGGCNLTLTCSQVITNNCNPGFSPSYSFVCSLDNAGRCTPTGSTTCTCQ